MHKFYARVLEVLFGYFAAKRLKFNFPLFDEASPSRVEVVGVSRMGHYFCCRGGIIQGNGLKEINIYISGMCSAQKGISFEERGILPAINFCHCSHKRRSFSALAVG